MQKPRPLCQVNMSLHLCLVGITQSTHIRWKVSRRIISPKISYNPCPSAERISLWPAYVLFSIQIVIFSWCFCLLPRFSLCSVPWVQMASSLNMKTCFPMRATWGCWGPSMHTGTWAAKQGDGPCRENGMCRAATWKRGEEGEIRIVKCMFLIIKIKHVHWREFGNV